MTYGIRRAAIFGAILAGAAAAHAQTDLALQQAFSCDAQGNPMSPEVGKPFYVGIRYSVTGTVKKTYRIRIQTSYTDLSTPDLSFGIGAPGTYQVTWGPIQTLMDRSIPVTVTLDATKKVGESNEKNNVQGFDVLPQSPSGALDFYNSQLLSGQTSFYMSYARSSAAPTSLTIAHPIPVSESFQEVVRQYLPMATQVPDQNGQPFLLNILQQPGLAPVSAEQSVITRAASIRVNLNLINQVSWADLDAAAPTVDEWLASEYYIPIGNSTINAFVSKNLPKSYRATMTPANTAETLYRALLRDFKYDSRKGLEPSAINTIKSKKGDCGGLSAAYVGLLRTVGIPARTVAGYTEGENQWHVWAEFYLPNVGWVPADPAYAEGMMPTGDTPIFFGVIPNLNARIATSFGLDREAGSYLAPLLQSTRVQWTGKNVRVASAYSNSSLRVVEPAN